LGDYFSDDEEDDTWDREDLKIESHYWSHTQFNDSEDNSSLSQPTLSKWDLVISGWKPSTKQDSKKTVKPTIYLASQKKQYSVF
jgi:hypothetical protein